MQEQLNERKSMAPINFSRYEITRDGHVFKLSNNKELKGFVRCRNGKSHKIMRLTDDNGRKKVEVFVHRAILQIFVGPAPENMFGLHINGNTLDNNLENLEWGPRPINKNKALNYTARPVLQYNLLGELVNRWENTRDAVKSLGFIRTHIVNAIDEGKIAYGFRWYYESEDVIEGEVWKPVGLKYYSKYTVSNMGRIKKQGDDKCYIGSNTEGYLSFPLYNDKTGEDDRWRVHRLVAFTFLKPRKGAPEVNHKNGIKIDNRAENLEFVTPSENTLHAVGSDLLVNRSGIEIIKIDKQTDKIIGFFESITIASRETKLSSDSISRVCRGLNPTKSNFTWSYANNPEYSEKLKIYKARKSNELSTDFIQPTKIKSETCGIITHIDLKNRQITKYDSVQEASIATGLTINNIRCGFNKTTTNAPKNSIWREGGYFKQELNKNMLINYIIHKDDLCM